MSVCVGLCGLLSVYVYILVYVCIFMCVCLLGTLAELTSWTREHRAAAA